MVPPFSLLHVLGEVEDICDRVGVIVGARLRRVDAVAALIEASRRRVRVTVAADVGPETLSVVPGVSGVSVRGDGDPTVTILECEVMGGLDGVAPLLAATTATVLLVLFHGLVALGVAAGTGSRSASIGVATTLFAGGYILNALGGLVPGIEPFRVLAPCHQALDRTHFSRVGRRGPSAFWQHCVSRPSWVR